jgi:cysteine synthase
LFVQPASSGAPAACVLSVFGAAERVTDADSFTITGRLPPEEGLLVGGSSGAAVVVALRLAAWGCDGPVAAALADSWDRYFSRPRMQPS